jgi:hypothetical protein
MQRRTFALQVEVAGVTEAPDPLDRDPTALDRVTMPALVVVGAHDHAEFVSQPEAFAALLLEFLAST